MGAAPYPALAARRVVSASSWLWVQPIRLAVPCRHVQAGREAPNGRPFLGRRGLEPRFSDSVVSIYLYATRPVSGCRSFPAVTAACRLLAVSPDRYTFLLPSCALSPEARSACTSHEHWIWCRRLDSNQRHSSWRGALPTELHLQIPTLFMSWWAS